MKIMILLILVMFTLFSGQVIAATDTYDSGGPIMKEQAAYDVTYHDLSLFVNPADSSIDGLVIIKANIVQPLDVFVLDLDTLLKVKSVRELTNSKSDMLSFIHFNGKIWIDLKWTRQSNEKLSVQVEYGGRPRIAPSPPWLGGFTWSSTSDGSPWIATSCQGEGADIWWPNKDHVSDKPDSMRMHIRIPESLVVASNGRLESIESNGDQTTTYHWFVSTPINNYNVALNIAPYKVIEEDYTSVTGEIIPVSFWVLPEDYEKGLKFFPEIINHLSFFENVLGPYPFRADKYGVAQTPHLGMEHQTIIAYGAGFNNGAMTRGEDWGFDALHHHELSHEWWGNVITNSDWRDMWIHEGFGTYMQALYLEQTQGIEFYHQYLKSIRNFWNMKPIAPTYSITSGETAGLAIYFKGAWVLHNLRYLLGDDTFRLFLRRMIYPTTEMEKIIDGKQVRFVSTKDVLYLAESLSGKDLDWFFNVYLRQAELPILITQINNDHLKIRWDLPIDQEFPMPVDVKIGDKTERIQIPNNGIEIKLEDDVIPEIDPDNWLLYREPFPEVMELDSSTYDKYVGQYEVEVRNVLRKIEIFRKGEILFLKADRLPQLQMFPVSKSQFIFKESDDIRVDFNFNQNGAIESLTHNFFPKQATYKKIK